jgi:hypothetical protein
VPKSRAKLAEIAQRHWCNEHEQLVWAVTAQGYVGSTVGVVRAAPHAPVNEVPDVEVPEPGWPLPTDAVTSGLTRGDEWVHDPAMWAWAYAQDPARTAVTWADLFTVGRDECLLLLTGRRVALVVDSAVVEPGSAPTGGLLGRVRAFGQDREEPSLVTWWEAPVAEVRRFVAVPLGRMVVPEWFVRVEFTDGSAFDFRDDRAEQSVRTACANL